ncbi:MAG: hypothetical protein KDE29_07855 [Anaerolineales bacterium]|jgi:hypothetical protein|nr:hypothetical protein [Anaerolineales bacterium]
MGEIKNPHRGGEKHCSYLVYRGVLPTKQLVIEGYTPDPQRFFALRHELLTFTVKSKALRFANVLAYCSSGW